MTRRERGMVFVRSVAAFFCLLALILAVAGRADYWQGWGFCALMGVAAYVQELVFAIDPALARERKRLGKGVKGWDLAFLLPFGFLVPATALFGAADAGRYLWSPDLPPLAYAAGYAMMAFGIAWFFWPMFVNTWFTLTVRVQEDRGHVVVRSGPYRFVRHPGYVGGILMIIAVPLTLGSAWALIPAAVSAAMLVIRTALEDRTLHVELPGYREYAQEVRYRLLPRVW